MVQMAANYETYIKRIKSDLAPLNLLGLNPLKPLNKISAILMTSLIALNQFLAVCLFTKKTTMKVWANFLETSNFFILTALLLGCFTLKRETIQILAYKIKKFWSSDMDCKELISLNYVVKYYYRLYILTVIIYTLKPIITNTLAMTIYEPSFCPRQIIFLFSLFSYWLCCIVMSRDPFFASVLLLLALQFKILANRIREIKFTEGNEKNIQKEIERCVEHHNFLFGFLDDVNNANRVNMFIRVFIGELLVCAEMILCIKVKTDLGQILGSIVAGLLMASMFVALYAWPASCVVEQAADIYLACYESNWYNCNNIETRRALMVIMQRAQRETAIEAGKFFNVNMATATQFFKATLSFFSFINTMS